MEETRDTMKILLNVCEAPLTSSATLVVVGELLFVGSVLEEVLVEGIWSPPETSFTGEVLLVVGSTDEGVVGTAGGLDAGVLAFGFIGTAVFLGAGAVELFFGLLGAAGFVGLLGTEEVVGLLGTEEVVGLFESIKEGPFVCE